MQFSAKILQNNGLTPPVWEILDLPLDWPNTAGFGLFPYVHGHLAVDRGGFSSAYGVQCFIVNEQVHVNDWKLIRI